MLQKHAQHLFWRAGFGETLSVVKEAEKHSAKQVFKKMLKESENFVPIAVVEPPDVAGDFRKLREMRMEKKENGAGGFDRDKLKELQKERREEQAKLNIAWLDLMSIDKGVLREKMAFFWHGHLVARSINASFSQSYVNTLRKYALGNFGDLLLAVSKEPSMLQFLNNKQNKKRSPNENFARELMELFTLGRGNYTEKDIKEVAKAFTGWDFDIKGNFIFRERQHDEEEKTVFGKKGFFKGEDIIQMILENKQTAVFITTKIYQNFVNENTSNPWHQGKIKDLAAKFYKTNYDIADLLENIYTSDWFYDKQNIGTHVKSPVELLVGLKRTLGLSFEEEQTNLFIQRVLGQVLLYPPNVAGWPGGKNWIDSSSLLFRMQIPALIFTDKQPEINAKSDGDINTDYQTRKRSFRANINWEIYAKDFPDKEPKLMAEINDFVLQVSSTKAVVQGIQDKIKTDSKPENVKKASIALMMLPEYQLC
ncbi:DUF1800 family protein [Emticicia sp. BO119]|uniref:DUF1800 domain-containing protein n=1 Tax=Emticicia sp. BO119 TaxID=2757768 RepID=UPI0015F06B6F|nr:DUF1800 domain-containing protein [Emticicia sp. BO119]MBA4853944.1 DUF1800 domain-containing protein [Emticicia sp. BO119]